MLYIPLFSPRNPQLLNSAKAHIFATDLTLISEVGKLGCFATEFLFRVVTIAYSGARFSLSLSRPLLFFSAVRSSSPQLSFAATICTISPFQRIYVPLQVSRVLLDV